MPKLVKNTDNLVACRIEECNSKDLFLINTWEISLSIVLHPLIYLAHSKLCLIPVPPLPKVSVGSTVWRQKRLSEILLKGDEPNVIPVEQPARANETCNTLAASNKLIDILPDEGLNIIEML